MSFGIEASNSKNFLVIGWLNDIFFACNACLLNNFNNLNLSLHILLGSFFSIVGAIGLLRFPYFFSRLHAAGLTDTLGAWCLLSGFVL